MDRPNIVLICVDQWRGDCLSAAGHPVVRTPYLDELADGGTRFSRAYSATPTCVPARVAMMTGQSQEAHGRVGYSDGVNFDEAHPVSLPRELRNAGYQTEAIGKMHVYPERSRIGFDDVRLHDGYLHAARRRNRRDFREIDDYLPWLQAQAGATAVEDYTDNGLNCNSVVARPWDKAEALHPTNWIATEAISWLYRRDPTAPFFLYLSFHRPHSPLDPPQWAFDQYVHGPLAEPVTGNWMDDYAEHRRDGAHNALVGRQDAQTHHRAKAGYYGHMSHIDQQVNRFLEALWEMGLRENTVVIFTSDHGDMMGDHDMYRKGFPYEGSASVPLLVSAPRGYGGRGTVVDDVVELRDIMPTVLELACADIPDTVDGRSLVPFLQGERVQWREDLHGEHALLGQSLQWVTDGKRKFVWMSGEGREQFFDLEADPQETTNLVRDPARASEVEKWRGRLIDYLRDREEGYVQDGRLVAGRTPLNALSRVPKPVL
ncbi:arylsulfatase A-like enzyme [Arthrobacter pigmenti]|uniref:Arylsulfatase A-like enzyme n=1 Tax=Arthrobacter pigmenti TaxID=271432 RepID=A0A846RXM2_9MICC|nr:arylsulfatase A-like enzyme [Arthrobacter pigmenti]